LRSAARKGERRGILMRNILFWLFYCVLLFVLFWFVLGHFGVVPGPQALLQMYFGVSRAVAFWIVLGALGLAGATVYRTGQW
jgi:hypothetical protein